MRILRYTGDLSLSERSHTRPTRWSPFNELERRRLKGVEMLPLLVIRDLGTSKTLRPFRTAPPCRIRYNTDNSTCTLLTLGPFDGLPGPRVSATASGATSVRTPGSDTGERTLPRCSFPSLWGSHCQTSLRSERAADGVWVWERTGTRGERGL